MMRRSETRKEVSPDGRRLGSFARGCAYGLVAGVCLAAAEVFWLGWTSTSLPWVFVLYAALGDVLLIGIIGALVGMCANPEESAGAWLALLGLAVVCVYGTHVLLHLSGPVSKAGMPLKTALAVLWCACCIFAGLMAKRWMFPGARGPFNAGFVMSLLAISFGVVGGLYINKVYLPGFFELPSLIANGALLAVIAGLLLVGQRRLCSNRNAGGYPSRSGLWLLLIAAVVSVGAVWSDGRESALLSPGYATRSDVQPSSAGPSVLIICLDTLRADHVSAYGYHRKTTPHIDELCRNAELYRHAVAPTSWTLPSHASFFTGLLPTEHGAHFLTVDEKGINNATTTRMQGMITPAAPLSESATTLAEVLAGNGFRCGAIVANCGYLWHGFRLDQGFEYYDDRRGFFVPCRPIFDLRRVPGLADLFQHSFVFYRDATEITDECIKWLESNGESRFFLFVNYMDVHTPYAPPIGYRGCFAQPLEDASGSSAAVAAAVMREETQLTDAQRRYLVNRYDEELRYLDGQVGRLLDWLKRTELYVPTLIVVLSDHGESFGEHSHMKHMGCLYEQEVWVPLIVKRPNMAEERVTPTTVSLTEVPNIILETLGLERFTQSAPLVAELYPCADLVRNYGSRFDRTLRCVYRDDRKYILSSDGTVEVYDLSRDPHELQDIAETLPDEVRQVSVEVHQLAHRAQQSRFEGSVEPEVAARMVERLRAIGYLR